MFPTGRELMFFVHKHFNSVVTTEALYSLEDLQKVELHGENIEDFLLRWTAMMGSMKYELPKAATDEMFLPASQEISSY